MRFSKKPKKSSARERWINTRLEYGPDGRLLHRDGFWHRGPVLEAGGAQSRGGSWRFSDDGTETGAVLLGTVNTNPAKGDLVNGTVYHIRFGIEEAAGGSLMNFSPQLQYNKNSGGWVNVDGSSSNIQSAAGGLVDGEDTVARSGVSQGEYTEDTTNEGADEVDGIAGGNTADLSNTGAEFVWSFQIIDADVTDADTIEVRPIMANGGADLDFYDQGWPTITVDKDASVTVGITNVLATAAVGTVQALFSLLLSTVLATSAVGSVSPGVTVALTGVGGTAAVGDVGVTKSGTVALTGVGGTAAVGSVGNGTSVALTSADGGGGGGAPVLETYTEQGSTTASASLVLTKPSGVVSGDLLILICMNEDDTSIDQFTDNHAGWTFLLNTGNSSSACHTGVFWRISDGTEGASESVTAQSSDQWMGFYLRVSGAHATTPIDSSLPGVSTGNASNHPVLGVTTSVDDCLIFCALVFDGGDGFPFSVIGSGWTKVDDFQTGVSPTDDVSGVFGKKDLPTAGASGTVTIACSLPDGAAWFQVAIAPSGGGVAAAVGSVGPANTQDITGEEATAAVGNVSAGGDVEVELSGVEATSAVGNVGFTKSGSVGLTGVAGTSAVGDVAPDTSLALTGEQATSAVGSVGNETSAALSGEEATSAVGSVDNETDVPLTGVGGAAAVGSVSVEGEAGAVLTGVGSAAAVGSVGVTKSGTVALTGVEATAAVGDVGISNDQELSGEGATAAVGSVNNSVSVALTGVGGTSAVGNVGVQISLPLTGVEATAAVGNVSFTKSGSVALTGVVAVAAVGSVKAADVGQPMTASPSISPVLTATPGIQPVMTATPKLEP